MLAPRPIVKTFLLLNCRIDFAPSLPLVPLDLFAKYSPLVNCLNSGRRRLLVAWLTGKPFLNSE